MTWNSPLSGLTPHAPISSPVPGEVGRIKSAVARMYGIERRWMQHQSNPEVTHTRFVCAKR